jgi:hypothetical protein
VAGAASVDDADPSVLPAWPWRSDTSGRPRSHRPSAQHDRWLWPSDSEDVGEPAAEVVLTLSPTDVGSFADICRSVRCGARVHPRDGGVTS